MPGNRGLTRSVTLLEAARRQRRSDEPPAVVLDVYWRQVWTLCGAALSANVPSATSTGVQGVVEPAILEATPAEPEWAASTRRTGGVTRGS